MEIKKTLLNFGFGRKAHRLLGIDIGRNFVRLVELSYSGSGYQIEACMHTALSEPAVSNEEIIAAIKNMLKEVPFKTKDTAIALAHSLVIFEEVKVDAGLSAEETTEFLRFNLAKYTSDSNGEINFDYQTIEATTGLSVHTVLQLVAVRHEQVEKWVKLLRKIDLYPKLIDVDVYALERAVRWQLKDIAGPVAVINIDYGNVFIVVIDREKIIHVQDDFIGSENLESVAKVVEQIDLKLRMIYSVLSESLSQIVLAGESVMLTGLLEALSKRLSIRAMVANPFLDMQLSPAVSPELVCQLAPMMLVGCGLALRAADGYKN